MSEVFVVQSHLSNPTKRVEYPITGPLSDDLRLVIKDYVLQKPEPAP